MRSLFASAMIYKRILLLHVLLVTGLIVHPGPDTGLFGFIIYLIVYLPRVSVSREYLTAFQSQDHVERAKKATHHPTTFVLFLSLIFVILKVLAPVSHIFDFLAFLILSATLLFLLILCPYAAAHLTFAIVKQRRENRM